VLSTVFATIALAAIYIAASPPQYTATAALMPDTRRTPASPIQANAETIVDAGFIETQIEYLRSDRIALAAINDLALWNDPEFTEPAPGLLSRIIAGIQALKTIITAPFSSRQEQPEDSRQRLVLSRFKNQLAISRISRSYIASIAFTSVDPKKAARVANQVAEAYIKDQLGAPFSNAERASAWMQQRVDELRSQANEAAQLAQQFKDTTRQATEGRGGDMYVEHRERPEQFRDLEIAAQRKKSLYESLLNRYNRLSQFVEQYSVPTTEARIVTEALPPANKSYPKTGLTLLAAAFFGGAIGLVGAFAREYFDRRLRTREQIERDLGVRCLGFLPVVSTRAVRKEGMASGLSHPGAAQIPLYFQDSAEVLRHVRFAIDFDDRNSGGRVVGIVSPKSGDGTSTFALNFAMTLAEDGHPAALIDADLRHRTLTRSFAPNVAIGLEDILQGEQVSKEKILSRLDGFCFLAAGSRRSSAHPAHLLASPRMDELLDRMRAKFRYVLLDLPPALERVDAVACAHLVDAYVIVAHAERTSADDVINTLRSQPLIFQRALGLVVNASRSASGRLY
jgi:succinoglycan biosynthesis transport protein ExoP